MTEKFTNEKMNTYPELGTVTKYRLQINRIKDYFVAEIETISKAHSKYNPAFECFDKTLMILSATSAIYSISSLATAVGAPG